MSEQSGFSNSMRRDTARPGEDAAEAPFQNERGFRSSDNTDNRLESRLQALSPDKPVLTADNLNNLDPNQLSILQRSLVAASDQWNKVVDPLRNVFNKMKREEMSGTENANGENWAKNYMDKVLGVLRANMSDLSAEVPFRVAFPVQSFLPGAGGQVKAETLYAFFPPLQTDLNERYVTFPLHSPDESREAQLRRQPSFANSISSHEFEFKCKVSKVNDRPLLERRGGRAD